MRKTIFVVFLICFTASFVQGQSQPATDPSSPKTQTQSEQRVGDDFVIGLEDVLAINVWKEPNFSIDGVVVRPDGKITMPLLNDVQAEGLTLKQLKDLLIERLKQYLANPEVTIIVKQINSQRVSIVGEVVKPGVYVIGAPMSVLELLARAGGLRDYANKKNISIVRQEGKRISRFEFNFKDIAEGRNLEQNILLKNGDVVIVP